MKKSENLTKQQKQLVGLIGFVGLIVLYALFQFVLMPLLGSDAEARIERDELKAKLEKANLAIKGEMRLKEESTRTLQELHQAAEVYIPPVENALAWVTEQVYNTAREVGVEIQWVERVVNNEAAQLANAGAADVFTPYKVRVLSLCSYSKSIQFIELLEQGNPYLCISEVTISGQTDNVESHRVNFVAEWPIWTDQAAIRDLSMNQSKEGL